MLKNLAPLGAAFATLVLVYFLGVVFVFEPVLATDSPGDPIVHPAVGLLVTSVVYVAFFEWVRRAMGSAMKAALAIAISQLLLVDFDYGLSGKRGIEAAGASALLLIVAWTAVAIAFDMVAKTKFGAAPDG